MGTRSTDRLLSGVGKPAPAPFRRPQNRASFPRRVTLDLDDARYEWLKLQAWQSRIPGGVAGLLRALIDAAESDEELLAAALTSVEDSASGQR